MYLRRRLARLADRMAMCGGDRLPPPDDDDFGDARMAATFAEWAASGWFADEPDFPQVLATYQRAIATNYAAGIAAQRQRILRMVEREVEAVIGPLTGTARVLDIHDAAWFGHLTPAVVIVGGRAELSMECEEC